MSESDNDDAEQPPPLPPRPDRSEKALGLELARLFGINPKTMMAPKEPPQTASPAPEDEEASGDPEAPEA